MRLARLVDAARRICAGSGLGRALIALGGGMEPGFGLPPLPNGPTPLALAALGSVRAARRSGRLLGSLAAQAGVDLVMGPRLDLATDPKDGAGAIGGFGEDYGTASDLGGAFAAGLAAAGVEACVGRFPGLGSTCAECYDGMPFISFPAARFESCEMRPFARAARSGAAATLVGRVLVPALEPERIPACRSARIIEGRLRESLGFRGLVIGEGYELDPDPGKTAVLSVLAGCDLCLVARSEVALAVAAALDAADAKGELPAVRTEVARRRLDSLLDRSRRRSDAGAASEPRLRETIKAERDIERAFTVLRGSLALGRAGEDFSGSLVLVFLPPAGSADAPESEAALAALRAALPGASFAALPAEPRPEDAEVLSTILSDGNGASALPFSGFSRAAILTYDAHFRPAQEGLARLVEESVPRVVVVAVRDPYDAAFFPRAAGLGAAFGFSEASFKAIGRLLRGASRGAP
ncbi:MAG: glycoside hydrolase family 3 N-terminal domain-containing protein, partial [Spirochaetaceae bacterium]|nr:glycoside hydrolase family 3 N-terminal domain-containing protein [Spirochaetaceae bacterium]